MIQFIKTIKQSKPIDNSISEVKFTIKNADVTLDEIVEEFSNFLKAIGYGFDSLEVISNMVKENEFDRN